MGNLCITYILHCLPNPVLQNLTSLTNGPLSINKFSIIFLINLYMAQSLETIYKYIYVIAYSMKPLVIAYSMKPPEIAYSMKPPVIAHSMKPPVAEMR